MYTPTKTDLIRLTTSNSEATNIYNEGKSEVEVNFVAPAGIVALPARVNPISNPKWAVHDTDWLEVFLTFTLPCIDALRNIGVISKLSGNRI